MVIQTFSNENFRAICDELSQMDADLKSVISLYGYPPMWTRPNNFESLVHIILEQQVSLASALAALHKLKERLVELTPELVLSLTDEELKSCYFSRQKTKYVRGLAEALSNGIIELTALEHLPDHEVRSILSQLKGVGNWTVDVYLMFVLQRADLFPIGDLAAVNALKRLKKLPPETDRETLQDLASGWAPYRTVATMILWHYYLSRRSG